MTMKISLIIAAILLALLTSCFIGAGSHGSLKGYKYATTKDSLERAVMFVIKNNPNIYRDTIGKHYLANVGNGRQDTIIDNSYNDGKEYVSIKIKVRDFENEYTFRYYGDVDNWKVSKTSEIFICWAYDKNNKGGSEGNGGVDRKLLKQLTDVFEAELVDKIDKVLNLTHIETK